MRPRKTPSASRLSFVLPPSFLRSCKPSVSAIAKLLFIIKVLVKKNYRTSLNYPSKYLFCKQRKSICFFLIRSLNVGGAERQLVELTKGLSAFLFRFPDAIIVNSFAGQRFHNHIGYKIKG